MSKNNKLTIQEIELILSGKYTNIELSKMLNRSTRTIYQYAKNYNIVLKKYDPTSDKIQNKELFKTWNIETSYLIGFLAADGCISKRWNRKSHCIKITLSEKDRDHLVKIRDLFQVSYDIKIHNTNYKKCKSCSLTIHSKDMANDLIHIGITEKKSLTLKWINQCPNEYISHMMRGYFDGDGCIINYNLQESKIGQIRATLLGTENFLLGARNFYSKSHKKIGVIKPKDNYFVWSFNGTLGPLSFLDWIYQDSTNLTRLDRKYDKYKDYKKYYLKEKPKNIRPGCKKFFEEYLLSQDDLVKKY